MVQTLARSNKAIAWFCSCLFYLQFILSPVAAEAGIRNFRPRFAFAESGVKLPPNPENKKSSIFRKKGSAIDIPSEVKENKKIVQPDSVSGEKAVKKTFTTGPTQPEMASFQSVNANNLVDLFSGDFSYNIPLLDVGGYPVNLHYQAGISMEQEASWVGLGWNINPGVISRNMRGLPDDFKGEADQVTKTLSIKPNETVGVNAGADIELTGLPIGLEGSLGVFHNSYKGWGTELSFNASVNAGKNAKGSLTGAMGLSLNSQNGIDVSPSFGYKMGEEDSKTKGKISVGSNYNSRTGIQLLQVSGTVKQTMQAGKKLAFSIGTKLNAGISFSQPSFTPTINMPYTSRLTTLQIKLGTELWTLHPSGMLRGYRSVQEIEESDKVLRLPAYGYLHYQDAQGNQQALLDFNREKDIAYNNNTPHIAVPMYTYDTWSISGEGTGGMFRAYRGDIGAVYDHTMSTKSTSGKVGVDVGIGGVLHVGVDNHNSYSYTSTGPWISSNAMFEATKFRFKDSTFENVYFKNPGEKTAVNKSFLSAIGNDSLMRVVLTPLGNVQNDPAAGATNTMALFNNGRQYDTRTITSNVLRKNREKRTQLISYLTAKEAVTAGLDKFVKSYYINQFPDGSCNGYTTISRQYETGRQDHHLSEITVLNNDGRRYVYGIPVYNKKTVDVTMSVSGDDNNTGVIGYQAGVDNSTGNSKGKEGYFNKEELPPYAHSFLLSGVLSPDYVDLTGDGITEDDQGDAVKFNYSRVYNMNKPYGWRAPFQANTAFFNEGTKTDSRDNKASYTYGEREVWMLNSIESKTMIATFELDNSRMDGYGVHNENGAQVINDTLKLYRLKKINLYAKADWLKYGKNAAKPIKTVHFAYSYALCKGAPGSASASYGKLTLDSVWFTYNGRGRAAKNAYKFKYHSSNPDFGTRASDRWGTYKPGERNPGSPGSPLSNEDYSYSLQKGNGNWNKDSADKYAASWALSEIGLPSGGRIKVSYESDDYAYVQNKRAMQLFKIEGFALHYNSTPGLELYQDPALDYPYVFIRLNESVKSVNDFKRKYLEGIDKLYFKLMVSMPGDVFGSGSEIVPGYAEFDDIHWTPSDSSRICIRVKPFIKNESPFAAAAIQYIRLNHPHKAYPNSEPGNSPDLKTILSLMIPAFNDISAAIDGFSYYARTKKFGRVTIAGKSFVRLNNPDYRKFGGGHRVKKVEVFDSWNQMTGNKQAVYGQEYNYTTTIEVDGEEKVISSGVASYEPGVGNDENPFHVPVSLYSEKVGALAPTNYLYTEEPFVETFFPAPSVGYSKVTVQSIHKTKKSATGITKTEFYTTKDFPTLVEMTPLDRESKKTYNPSIRNFLRVDAKNYVTLSQGFKIELNDMNGKVKTAASYAQTDLKNPISFTQNYYRVENDNALRKKLSNKVAVINDSTKTVDEEGEIGKEVEIMIDVREQTSVSGSFSVELNVDLVNIIPPINIGSIIPIPSKQTDRYRSIAVLKVVNRYGILDSVVIIEKGSKVSTRNLVFDAETGEPVVTRTNNMFDDPVYNLNYPAHWAYSGMGPAYKNHGVLLRNLELRRGILFKAGKEVDLGRFFESGDELLVRGKFSRSENAPSDVCAGGYYSYKNIVTDSIVWVINGNKGIEQEKGFYFIDRRGYPVTAEVEFMKVVRSGKRNTTSVPVQSVTSLASPVRANQLLVDDSTKVIGAEAATFKDKWKVEKVIRQYDSCVVERDTQYAMIPYINSLILNFHTPEYLDGIAVTHYNHVDILAAYRQWGTSYFMARSMLRLNMQNIPGDAEILEAKLTLKGRSPSNHFGVLPFSNPNLNYSYEGEEEDTKGYILPFTNSITPGGNVDWVKDEDLNSSPYKVEIPFLGHFNRCVDYPDQEIKVAVQQLVGKNPDQQNLLLKLHTEANLHGSQETRFMNFYGGQPAEGFTMQSSFSTLASDCVGTPAYDGCNLRSCPGSLNIKYTYGVTRCYKICRQEYLQGDTLNPYVVGILGNWRVDTGFVYYSNRKESSVSTETNIRTDGQILDFAPYWVREGKNLNPKPDPSRWAWTTKSTLSNRRGLELENQDPLNRFNAALYGYNKTMPIATAQNAQIREIAYDGFEDQEYQTDNCNKCFESGWMKLNADNGRRTVAQSHSGRSSLEVYGNKSMEMNIPVSGVNLYDTASLSFRRDSVALIDTLIVPNGYGLTGQSGVYKANRFIGPNICVGRNINDIEWWPETYITNVNVDYGTAAPPVICATNYFKVRFTGKLLAKQTGYYQFEPGFDDYLKVWLNGNMIIEQYNGHQTKETGLIWLTKGFHDIQTELTEEEGGAYINLQWRTPYNSTYNNIELEYQYASQEVADNSFAVIYDTTWCYGLTPVKKFNGIAKEYTPVRSSKIVVGAWVKENVAHDGTGYKNAAIKISFTGSSETATFKPSGRVIDGWQRIEGVIEVPEGATNMKYELLSSSSNAAFFDDVRIHPFNANMKSFVYDPVNVRLLAEMDENNYSTFYEYDDEGTLVRVKKETERGVKTIKESRSALLKKEIQDQP